MNKERYIWQYGFNGNLNGYYAWSDGGDWDSCVNYQSVGLYTRNCLDELKYYIT